MNKKLTLIILIETLLIVALFWVLIFYGKDEYEAYQANPHEEIESPSHVATKQGISMVTLSPAMQQNSGISTAKISAASFKSEHKSWGNVVAIDGLIEAKAKYLNLVSDIAVSRAANSQNLKQYQRLKALNEDDKNVSDRAVQEALATANADQAKVTVSEMQLKNLQSTLKLQWGEALAQLVFGDKLPPHLQNLLNRKNVLVQVSLPLNAATPKAGVSISIAPLNETGGAVQAIYVSPATQADASNYGKTFYYSAPAESLRIGMRVSVDAPSAGNANDGAIIPSEAVVWYAGKPWAYFKQGRNKEGFDQFVRKPITADAEVNGGWFNQNLNADSEVVVNGAQLLLSEEFKYQIKNENED